ncbi:LRC15 protein, partial [Acromyrmex insinuator]
KMVGIPCSCADEKLSDYEDDKLCALGPRTKDVYRTYNLPSRFIYPSENFDAYEVSAQSASEHTMCFLLLIYLLLLGNVADVFTEDADCQVYNHLYVCLENSSFLHSVAFEDVNAVQTIEDIELHLENLGIVNITRNAFIEVSNSSALYVRDNRLSSINRHYFDALDQLTYLDLKNNTIINVEDGAFVSLYNLETLLLDYNNISDLRPGVWKGLSELHELYITNNRLTLRRNMFKGLRQLETLVLDSNDIPEIPIGTFNGLSHIDLLYLSRNKISTLHPDVFRGLSEINELDLGRNRLRTIPANVFRYMKSLNSLWLNGNQLTVLKSDTFQGLDNLLFLFLNNNDLRYVDMAAFVRMRNVTVDPGFKVRGSLVDDFGKVHGQYQCNSVAYQIPYDCTEIDS